MARTKTTGALCLGEGVEHDARVEEEDCGHDEETQGKRQPPKGLRKHNNEHLSL